MNIANRYYIPWTRGAYPYTSLNRIAGRTGILIDGAPVPEGAGVSFWGYCGVPEPYTVSIYFGAGYFVSPTTSFKSTSIQSKLFTSLIFLPRYSE